METDNKTKRRIRPSYLVWFDSVGQTGASTIFFLPRKEIKWGEPSCLFDHCDLHTKREAEELIKAQKNPKIYHIAKVKWRRYSKRTKFVNGFWHRYILEDKNGTLHREDYCSVNWYGYKPEKQCKSYCFCNEVALGGKGSLEHFLSNDYHSSKK